MGRGFILRSTRPTQRAVYQPHEVEMSSQGIMSGKETRNNPGLHPVKGQKSSLGAKTGSRD
jgi:hypothetical protein